MAKHLTYTDRLVIEKLYNATPKTSIQNIANLLGYSRQTIYYEIKRGLYTKLNHDYTESLVYSADIAQQDRDYKQTSKGTDIKLTWDMVALCKEYILEKKYSPRALCSYLKQKGKDFVSYTTLYRYIDNGYIPNITRKHLPYPQKKKKYKKVAKRAPKGTSIEKRPKHINNRSEFGHWEMDSVVGRREGQGESLLVLTERKTRYEIMLKVKDKTSTSVVNALSKIRKQYGNIFKTITVDNGSEFSDYKGMLKYTNEVYYCHPYTSSERGSNENCNRIIRRFFPKGQSLKRIKPKQVQIVQDWINDLPRQILGYKTAKECFEDEVKIFYANVKIST